ncbi:hypothetical protein DM02DRAFT_711799 [Periconia macrospinosa]|uniref:Uncharacterized protein n=1 Tax=Periconia macrospinosa TaxID=97972 RepID=A0A2V1DMA8_9PLEO|nr:hypothetical protein DM02DRAFT_711799 [Periconia macrospinosa]
MADMTFWSFDLQLYFYKFRTKGIAETCLPNGSPAAQFLRHHGNTLRHHTLRNFQFPPYSTSGFLLSTSTTIISYICDSLRGLSAANLIFASPHRTAASDGPPDKVMTLLTGRYSQFVSLLRRHTKHHLRRNRGVFWPLAASASKTRPAKFDAKA